MEAAGASLRRFDAEPPPVSGRHEHALESGQLSARILPAQEAFEPLLFEWGRLVADASEPNPFLEPWFVRASLDHLAGTADIRLLEVRSGAFLIGLMPIFIAGHYGRFPVRNVQNWLHFHSFLGTPLVRAGQELRFWSAALDALDNEPWCRGFLHLNGLVAGGPVYRGLVAAAARQGRRCDVVHRTERALLESDLGPTAYYEATVRKKKRKELKRLQSRLAELGTLCARRFGAGDSLEDWCDSFLALERSGWKGAAGSALACHAETDAFFRDAIAGAHAAGRLELLRLDLDQRPIAMLVNFLTPPGSSSFKIAFDESFARFSPGVLLQIENLSLLDRADIGWMDSCAAEDHPMINSLWGERRTIIRVTVPLARLSSRALFHLCRPLETGWARLKRIRGRRKNVAGAEA